MIRVEPLTLPWIEALAEGDATFAERFQIEVVDGWLAFPETLPHMLEAVRANGVDEWGSHLFFEGDALVGFGGWKGPPSDGTAELGYAVAPERQGRGIATTAVAVLVDQARAAGVSTVVAHTLAATSPSTSVLVRSGFTMVRALEDPDDGPLWRWELDLVTQP
jgi:ribosomal-protein-alanine N-acetyltransferase